MKHISVGLAYKTGRSAQALPAEICAVFLSMHLARTCSDVFRARQWCRPSILGSVSGILLGLALLKLDQIVAFDPTSLPSPRAASAEVPVSDPGRDEAETITANMAQPATQAAPDQGAACLQPESD